MSPMELVEMLLLLWGLTKFGVPYSGPDYKGILLFRGSY